MADCLGCGGRLPAGRWKYCGENCQMAVWRAANRERYLEQNRAAQRRWKAKKRAARPAAESGGVG